MDEDRKETRKIPKLRRDFTRSVISISGRKTYVSDRTRRLIWWSFFLGAVSFSIFLFNGALNDFFQYKSYTVTEYDYDKNAVDFPTLTFCFQSPFTYLKANKRSIARNVEFINALYRESLVNIRKRHQVNRQPIRAQFVTDDHLPPYEEVLKLFTLNFNDTFDDRLTKIFLNKPCKFDSNQCSHKDFKTVLNHFNLPCLQYNYFSKDEPSKTQDSPRKYNGFEAYFNLHNDKAINGNINRQGINLYLHDRVRPHLPPYDVDIPLQPGHLTIITLEESKVIKLLKPPHGKCGERKHTLLTGLPFSLSACKYDCEDEFLYNRCGCVRFDFKEFVESRIPTCSIRTMATCYLLRKVPRPRRQFCRRTCMQECVQHKFPFRTEKRSLRLIKQHSIVKYRFNRSVDEQNAYIKENVVGIRIGYDNIIERREIATPSVTVISLLGTVGGSLSLGLGFSFLTFVELIFFISDFLYSRCVPTKTKPIKPCSVI